MTVSTATVHGGAGRRTAARPDPPAAAAGVTARGAVVYLAGARLSDDTAERALMTALAQHRPVLWVDPPRSVWRRRAPGPAGGGPVENLTCVQVPCLPGLGRAVARGLTRGLLRRRVQRAVRALPVRVDAVVSAAPHGILGRVDAPRRTVWVGDDPVRAGASGRRAAAVRRARAADVAAADVLVAGSPGLAARCAESGRPVVVMPAGCDPHPGATPADGPPPVRLPFDGPVVGLVADLDERLDLDLLRRLQAADLPVLVVGRLTAQDRRARQRLLSWLYSDGVHWVGACDAAARRAHCAAMAVGITPYRPGADTHEAFPPGMWDHLGAGVSVVTTRLPATAWLGSPLAVQAGPEEFVDAVRAAIARHDDTTAAACRALAARHGWAHRARQLAELCEPGASRTLA